MSRVMLNRLARGLPAVRGRVDPRDRRPPFAPPPLALRAAAILAVPLLLYGLYVTGQKALENYRLNRQADELRVQVSRLHDDNLALQQQLDEARSDAAIEKIAREQLDLVKPGDDPLVVPSDNTSRPAASQPSSPPPPSAPTSAPWTQWRDFFFGSAPAPP